MGVVMVGSKKTQSEMVYDHVRKDLMSATIRPGSRIRIGDYVELLDVRLGAVREALSKLSSEGWVIAEPQRGFRATPMTRQELIDLTATRIEIENLCLRDAIRRGNAHWEGQILARLHQLDRTPEHSDGGKLLSDDWANVHIAFHEALVAACSNLVMGRIRAQLYQQAERYRRLSVPLNTGDRNVSAEHHELAELTIARKADAAAESMRRHLTTTTDILLKSLDFEAAKVAVSAR